MIANHSDLASFLALVTTGPGKLLMGGVQKFGYLRPQNRQICVHKFDYLGWFSQGGTGIGIPDRRPVS